MRIIMLGAPGAGKGTQSKNLAEKLHVPHISTGDIFRSNIKSGTQLGIKAKEFMDAGKLVPDDVTIEIVKDRIAQEDCANGFILDGFPRTIPQAQYLEAELHEMGKPVDTVIDIEVSDDEIITRMSGRRVCPACGMSFHTVFNPPQKDNLCDNCGTKVVQREDDNEETVKNRLEVYHKQTEPLIAFYRNLGKLVAVRGQERVEDTTMQVFAALGV